MFKQILEKNVLPVFSSVSRGVSKIAPELSLIGGVAMGFTSAFYFAKAYKKADEVLEVPKANLESAKTMFKNWKEEDEDKRVLTEFEIAKVVSRCYGFYTISFAKHYGPTALMALSSLCLVLNSYGIMKGRNKQLAALSNVLALSFNQYRNRVRDEIGDVADERFLMGLNKKTIVEQEIGEDGKKKKKTTEVNEMSDSQDPLLYTRVFDESCAQFSLDRKTNKAILIAAENWFNVCLERHKVLILNDVYKYLGFPQTEYGCIIGWSLIKNPQGYVCLDLQNRVNTISTCPEIIINPNVDGVVSGDFGTNKSYSPDEYEKKSRWGLNRLFKGKVVNSLDE